MKKNIYSAFIVISLLLLTFLAFNIKVGAQSKKDQKTAKKFIEEADKNFQQKNFQAAIEKYSQAVALVPNNAKAHFWKGYAHYYLKDFDQSLTEMYAALAQGHAPLEVYKVR